MRVGLLAAATLLACFTQEFQGKTLGDVLAAHSVPSRVLPAADLQIPAERAGWSAKNSPFLIAYYDGNTETLPNLLHVVRYDLRTHKIQRTDLRAIDVTFHGFDSVMDRPSSDCLGAVLSISEEDGLVTIETHINPSAGCVLILTPDLKFSAGLYGWVLGRIRHDLIFEESMVHFASVHDSRLAVYDIDARKLFHIYPSQQEPERQLFSAQLAKHMLSDSWCAEHNNPCNSKSFNTEIEHLIVDPRRSNFAFDVQMTSEGFGPEAERVVKPKSIHYLCSKLNGKWRLSSSPAPRAPVP